jgi:hypothetical protein
MQALIPCPSNTFPFSSSGRLPKPVSNDAIKSIVICMIVIHIISIASFSAPVSKHGTCSRPRSRVGAQCSA